MDPRFMANPDVVCRQAASGPYLFNPDNGSIQGINEIGFLIWRMISRPRTQAEIAARLMGACEMEPPPAGGRSHDVAADVAAFLQALRPGGFVGLVLDDAAEAQRLPPPPAAAPEPAAAREAVRIPERSIYRGRSMLGLFRTGDALVVDPVPITAIRPGDVVVFQGSGPSGQPLDVVHRVISVSPAGLATRGDANPQMDEAPVSEENLRGRVTRLERNGWSRPVPGGRRGMLFARVGRARRAVLRWGGRRLRALGGLPYRWLRESGLVRRLWHPAFTLLALAARDGQGPENTWLIKFVRKHRTVAWWRPSIKHFRCRKPFDLVFFGMDRD